MSQRLVRDPSFCMLHACIVIIILFVDIANRDISRFAMSENFITTGQQGI